MVRRRAGFNVCPEETSKARASHAVEGEMIDWLRGGGGTLGDLPE